MAGKKPTVAQYLTAQIEASDLTNAEIAAALGYTQDRANMISMIRTGRSKLPINKIGAMAKVLKVDAAHLLRIVLSEYSPDTLAVLEEVLGAGMVTEGEAEVLSLFRKEAGGLPIQLKDEQLVTFQGWCKEAAKAAADEQRRHLKEGQKNLRTDRSREAVSMPATPASRLKIAG